LRSIDACTNRACEAEADLRRLNAQLDLHRQEKDSLEARLAVAERQTVLAQTALEREKGLLAEEVVPEPVVEAAQERLLSRESAVLDYRGRLGAIPLLIEETEALIETKTAHRDEAKLSVEKTKIYCPFDARVDAVSAQASQVVTASFQIATLTDVSALEIPVVLDPRDLRWADSRWLTDSADGAGPTVRVTCAVWGQAFSWTGHVKRIERVDETTRTAHVVVQIDELTARIELSQAGAAPALSVGMFCQAQLPITPLADALVVPRHAIQDGHFVYVFKPGPADPAQGTLAIKRVPSLRTVGQEVLVAYRQSETAPATDDAAPTTRPAEVCELQPGDQIIVSPLLKAVEGMPLQLRPSAETVAALSDDVPSDPAQPVLPLTTAGMALGILTGAH